MSKRFRFINTHLFSPVIEGVDLPDDDDIFHIPYSDITEKFINEGDYFIDSPWWEKQKDRCINGYEVPNTIEWGQGEVYIEGVNIICDGDKTIIPELGITLYGDTARISPKHYFYLNFWTIKGLDLKKGRKTKGYIAPRFTDLSWENWWIRERMRKEDCDNMWAKCRQRGLSEEEACDHGHIYLFDPGSQGLIIAGQQTYSDNTMRMCKNGLERLKNTQFYKRPTRGGGSKEYLRSKYGGSEIHNRTAQENEQAASGLSPTKTTYEETGLWKLGLLLETRDFIMPSQVAEGVKTGWQQFTGTGGKMGDSVDDMEKMARNPSKYNLLCFPNRHSDNPADINQDICRFIPYNRFAITDKWGNSLIENSNKEWQKIYDSKNTSKEQHIFRVLNPQKFDDIFQVESGGFFGEDIAENLNKRRTLIMKNKELLNYGIKYNLYWILSNGDEVEYAGKRWQDIVGMVEKVTDDGPYVRYEDPYVTEKDDRGFIIQPKDKYYCAGTDSYDQDQARTSNSKGAITIRKRFIDYKQSYYMWVAMLFDRPERAEYWHERCAKLCYQYNARNLIESRNKTIIDWFANFGFEYLLEERPLIATAEYIKDSKTSNRFGVDPVLKEPALKMLRDELSKEGVIDKLNNLDQINAFIKFKLDPKYNCDITVSSAYSILNEQEMDKIEIKKKPDRNRKPFINFAHSSDKIYQT